MEGIDVMIGRNDEKKYLLSLLEEEDAQFVAVFGRRRIGKHMMEQVSYEACSFLRFNVFL